MDIFDYFQSYDGYFWQWEDEGEVLAIPEASTIAYREFIFKLLQRLSPQGLPPFGPLLLAVIATNPGGKEHINIVYSILSRIIETTDDISLSGSISFLKLLAEMEPEYKQGPKRLLLLQTIFEGCHDILSIPKSRQLAKAYGDDSNKGRIDFKSIPVTKHVIQKDIRVISLLERRFSTVERILERMAGVVEFDENPELETRIDEVLKPNADFVDQLLSDTQTFPMAILLPHLWAALSIPFHQSLPSNQPLGGFSDLSNKGDFDRLLVSEFANDELLFLSRLANQEALYLNREVPPASEDRKRIILIDISLRSWGTPKTLAYALMLALTRSAKSTINSEVYGVGTGLYTLSFGTIHELIDSIRILDTSLSAAEGVGQLMEKYQERHQHEIIFISSVDSHKSPELQRLMAMRRDFFNYCIYTTTEGRVSVYKHQQSEQKLLQEFVLPLHELWKQKKSESKTYGYLVSLPILVKSPKNVKRIIRTEDAEVFQVTAERKVFRLFDRTAPKDKRGWELIAENLPFALNKIEIGLSVDKEHILFLFREQDTATFILNLDTGKAYNSKFEQYKHTSKQFVFHGDCFHYVSANNNWCIDLEGGVRKSEFYPKVILDKAKAREKELEELTNTMQVYYNNLIKLQQVFINQTGNLVFNGHELHVTNEGSIMLNKGEFARQEITASKISKRKFMFSDGSTVEIKRSGLFMLKSSDPTVLPIYIPNVLHIPLGVATDGSFSGSDYFYKEEKVDVVLEKLSPNRLHTVKVINDFTAIGLMASQEIIQNIPTTLLSGIPLIKANDLRRALEKVGALAVITKAHPELRRERLTPKSFFNKYIDVFVNTIRNGT
ncbi:ribosomal protein L7/L12 [Pedobacter frigoris]|uniref:ribosomal protein L7/L12 n=1 Tax=Pedobacter frigoris TaxID=2571272 RepID=UPI00292ECE2D|nr:ribosomal protein L7/L12 [Pedobacter frigoris]